MRRWLAGFAFGVILTPALGASVESAVTVSHGHHFQGMQQNERPLSMHGSARIDVGRFSVGAWIGRYEFPGSLITSTEVDYFIGYTKQFGFNHRIDTSLWHYTYSEDRLSSYEWSQWLTRYTFDGRITLTLGAADNLLRSDRPTVLAEALVRHRVSSRLSVSAAIGRHRFSEHVIDSFSYGTIKAVYTRGHWQFSADVTVTSENEGLTGQWTHEGISAAIAYRF